MDILESEGLVKHKKNTPKKIYVEHAVSAFERLPFDPDAMAAWVFSIKDYTTKVTKNE